MTKSQQETIHPPANSNRLALSGKNRERQRNALSSPHRRGAFFTSGLSGNSVRSSQDGDYLSRSILTGPLIDEKVVGWLKDTPPTRINITFNTAPPIKLMNAYAEILRDSHRSLKAIHLLKEAGIAIKINCSLTPYYTQLILNRYLNSAEKKIWSSQATSYMFPTT